MRALLCSGQGQIGRGMFDLLIGDDAAEAVLRSAGALLGRDPRAFLATADAEAITADRTGQILCTARSLAAAAALRIQTPAMIAGYSVGEMAAWGVAGIWSAEQTLRLTARRAELMDVADKGEGGLGFVRGLGEALLDSLLSSHNCAIAIRDPGGLFIIGGLRSDVAACCVSALQSGAAAARPIAVKVASHTPRLAAAVAPFEDLLAGEAASAPELTLIGAADATIIGAADGPAIAGLARQLATTVDWNAALTALTERGARRMLELGPGDALARMARTTWPDMDTRALDDFSTVEGARRWFDAA